jgi:DNA polymerase-1
MQNLAAPDEDSGEPREFQVRRAIIPCEGFRLISIDYSAMEFRVMLELAARLKGHTTPLIDKIKTGLDVHQATADLAGITRKQAKTTNFLTIYGGGNAKLAQGLGCSLDEAARIRTAIFTAAPEIKGFINSVIQTAERRGYVFGHLGRRWHFRDRNFSYKAPNHCIQGNCADVAKVAMNRVDEFLKQYKSKLVLVVHDEFIMEVAEDEMFHVPFAVRDMMVEAWESKYLPLEASISVGKNLADLEDL